MNFIGLGLCIIAISVIIGLLERWCRPVKYVELMRFHDNEVAEERYNKRLEAAGIGKVRNVRIKVEETP